MKLSFLILSFLLTQMCLFAQADLVMPDFPEQTLRHENADAATQQKASKLKRLGIAVLEYVFDNENWMDLTEANFVEKLTPYVPDETYFYADKEHKQRFFINPKINSINWQKLRESEMSFTTILFYEGEKQKLSFTNNGFAVVCLVAGQVWFVKKGEEKFAQFDVPDEFKK